MPRKNNSLINLEEAEQRYQAASDLRDSVIEASCFFWDDEDFTSSILPTAERYLGYSQRQYVLALIQHQRVERGSP